MKNLIRITFDVDHSVMGKYDPKEVTQVTKEVWGTNYEEVKEEARKLVREELGPDFKGTFYVNNTKNITPVEQKYANSVEEIKAIYSKENILVMTDIIADGAEILSKAIRIMQADGTMDKVADYASSNLSTVLDAMVPYIQAIGKIADDEEPRSKFKGYLKTFAVKYPLIALKAKNIKNSIYAIRKKVNQMSFYYTREDSNEEI